MFELKESDLPELERLAEKGYRWIARNGMRWKGTLAAYQPRPERGDNDLTFWFVKPSKIGWLRLDNELFQCVKESDPEPLNIADAIAQIKAQSHAKAHGAPLTWNERINQMTAEEKAELFDSLGFCIGGFVKDEDCNAHKDCEGCALLWLTSPCEGGEKE